MGLAVGLLLAGASSGAGGTDWKHLNYFIYETQEMLATTDGSWDGARVVRPIQPGQRTTLPPPNWAKRVKLERIWAPTCLSGRQSVTFTKTFKAPGKPFSGKLYLDPTFGFPRPFSGIDVLVNNRSIGYLGNISTGKIAQSISAPLTPDALQSFHYGTNKVTIRADKIALGKGEACNNTRRLIGIVAMLSLRFEPDLVAVPSPKGREQVTRGAAGQVVGALGNIRFKNKGPSGSSGGKLIFRIAANVNVETAWGPTTLQVNAPFHDCVGEGSGVAVVGTITCEYSDFPAGLNSAIFVLAAGRLTPNFRSDSTTSVSLDWQIVPAGGDVDPATNAYSHKFLICGPTAKDAACANAK